MSRSLNPLEIENGGTGGTTEDSARRGIGLKWLRFGSGVPSNSVGSNGEYYVRFDGTAAPTATKDHIYFKSGGTWGGIA